MQASSARPSGFQRGSAIRKRSPTSIQQELLQQQRSQPLPLEVPASPSGNSSSSYSNTGVSGVVSRTPAVQRAAPKSACADAVSPEAVASEAAASAACKGGNLGDGSSSGVKCVATVSVDNAAAARKANECTLSGLQPFKEEPLSGPARSDEGNYPQGLRQLRQQQHQRNPLFFLGMSLAGSRRPEKRCDVALDECVSLPYCGCTGCRLSSLSTSSPLEAGFVAASSRSDLQDERDSELLLKAAKKDLSGIEERPDLQYSFFSDEQAHPREQHVAPSAFSSRSDSATAHALDLQGTSNNACKGENLAMSSSTPQQVLRDLFLSQHFIESHHGASCAAAAANTKTAGISATSKAAPAPATTEEADGLDIMFKKNGITNEEEPQRWVLPGSVRPFEEKVTRVISNSEDAVFGLRSLCLRAAAMGPPPGLGFSQNSTAHTCDLSSKSTAASAVAASLSDKSMTAPTATAAVGPVASVSGSAGPAVTRRRVAVGCSSGELAKTPGCATTFLAGSGRPLFLGGEGMTDRSMYNSFNKSAAGTVKASESAKGVRVVWREATGEQRRFERGGNKAAAAAVVDTGTNSKQQQRQQHPSRGSTPSLGGAPKEYSCNLRWRAADNQRPRQKQQEEGLPRQRNMLLRAGEGAEVSRRSTRRHGVGCGGRGGINNGCNSARVQQACGAGGSGNSSGNSTISGMIKGESALRTVTAGALCDSKFEEKNQRWGYKVFFGNASAFTTEAEMYELFSKFGECSELVLLRDRRQRLRGAGFVTFKHSADACRAIEELDRKYTVLGGTKPLEVRIPENSEQKRERIRALARLRSEAARQKHEEEKLSNQPSPAPQQHGDQTLTNLPFVTRTAEAEGAFSSEDLSSKAVRAVATAAAAERRQRAGLSSSAASQTGRTFLAPVSFPETGFSGQELLALLRGYATRQMHREEDGDAANRLASMCAENLFLEREMSNRNQTASGSLVATHQQQRQLHPHEATLARFPDYNIPAPAGAAIGDRAGESGSIIREQLGTGSVIARGTGEVDFGEYSQKETSSKTNEIVSLWNPPHTAVGRYTGLAAKNAGTFSAGGIFQCSQVELAALNALADVLLLQRSNAGISLGSEAKTEEQQRKNNSSSHIPLVGAGASPESGSFVLDDTSPQQNTQSLQSARIEDVGLSLDERNRYPLDRCSVDQLPSLFYSSLCPRDLHFDCSSINSKSCEGKRTIDSDANTFVDRSPLDAQANATTAVSLERNFNAPTSNMLQS